MIAFLSYLSLSYFASKPVENRTTKTLVGTQKILRGYDATGVDILESSVIMSQAGDGLALNRAIFTLLANKGVKVEGVGVSSNGEFLDEWGTPFLFAITNTTQYDRLNPVMKREKWPFVIWSAGPNRTNEFGYGDDIYR